MSAFDEKYHSCKKITQEQGIWVDQKTKDDKMLMLFVEENRKFSRAFIYVDYCPICGKKA